MKNVLLAETLGKLYRKLGQKRFLMKVKLLIKIVNYLQSIGGQHTLEDFANAKGEFVSPINTDYRGKTVFQLPPNTQGIISLIILKIFRTFSIIKIKIQ
ncbi:MAG: hypothetical protein CM15mP81_10940 [Alphaproteobacteria bacterium]|nr:MAG: hypothetical protein CM15mP81_10940 [Alphaproteobacteria bacterium]